MTTITKLEQKTFNGKPSGYKVVLSDGTEGNLQEKESDKGLREGDPVAVTLIPYTSKQGKTSNLLGLKRIVNGSAPVAPIVPFGSPVAKPDRPQIHVGAGKSIEECKVMCLISVFEAVYEKMNNDSEPIETLSKNFKSVTPLLYEEVDAIFGKK